MFKQLINKYSTSGTKEQGRTSVGVAASIVGLVSNFLLFIIKFIAGSLSGSLSIMTDAMNNLGDSASSLITLLGFRAAAKPADKEHPYGHERSEYISGLLISVIIIYVGIQFLTTSIGQIKNPSNLTATPLVFGLLIISIVAKVIQGKFYRTSAETIQSNTLHSAAQDSTNDVFVTALVLVATLLEMWTGWQIDGYAGGLLSIGIIYSGIQAIRESSNDLLGTRPSKKDIREMKDLLEQYDSIVGYHDLLVHSYGPNQTFATIHIEIDDSWDIKQAHRVIDKIENDFEDKLGVELVCHLDPIAIQSEHDTAIYRQIKQILKSLHLELKFHDFKIETSVLQDTIMFDVVLPDNTVQTDDELLTIIKSRIQHQIGDYRVKIKFDRLDLLKEV